MDMHELFDKIRKNSIHILKQKRSALIRNQGNVAVGASKIGGKPHLPNGFIWPYFEGDSYENGVANRPLAFLAQFNLKEIHPYDTDCLLPDKGMLYFFYEADSMCWGDLGEEDCARVFYYNCDETELFETEFPDDLADDFRIPEQNINFENKFELPSYEEFDDSYENDLDWDCYDNLAADYGSEEIDDPADITKLLGYADLIQGNLLFECQMLHSGNNWNSYKLMSDTEKSRIKEQSKDWILLMQMGTITSKNFELMWGDCGCLYFMIRKEDLSSLAFDNIRLILQCG